MIEAAERQGNSFSITRILKAPAERVYRAFLDPAAIVKWSGPHGFTAIVDEVNPVEGGTYQMSFVNFGTQERHSFGGVFVELVPHSRIRMTSGFDDPALPGQMTTTAEIEETIAGARLTVTQAGLPDQIPDRVRHVGMAGIAGTAAPAGGGRHTITGVVPAGTIPGSMERGGLFPGARFGYWPVCSTVTTVWRPPRIL